MHIRIHLGLALGALIALPAAPSVAEDVERPAIILQAPKPPKARPPRTPQELAPPDTQPPKEGLRFASPFPGPHRIDLGPLGEIPPPQRPVQAEERQVVRERLAVFFGDAAARRRAETGQVSPAWLDLARRIEHHWQPEYSDIRDPRIAEVSSEWFKDVIWQWIGGWYLEVQRQRADPFLRPERVPGDDAGTASASMLDMQRDCLGDEYGNKVVTLVEVRFDAAGSSQARLLASSGHRLFDRKAIAGLEMALKHDLGEKPPPGPSRSIYALSAQYTILPPLPVVGFTFDLAPGGTVEFIYPFKKMLRSRAQLLAVFREEPSPTELR